MTIKRFWLKLDPSHDEPVVTIMLYDENNVQTWKYHGRLQSGMFTEFELGSELFEKELPHEYEVLEHDYTGKLSDMSKTNDRILFNRLHYGV